MNHRAHGGFVDAQAKSYGAYQHANFVRHPAFLIALAGARVHLGVIGDGGDAFFREIVDRLFDASDGRRVDDYVVARMGAHGGDQQARLLAAVFALLHQGAKIGSMEALDVFVWLLALELRLHILTYAASRAASARYDQSHSD